MATTVAVTSDIVVYKHPTATLDYSVDWTPWLGTDTIAQSTWVASTGITKASDGLVGAKATVWLSGGTDKASYTVVNTVVTTQGRTETKSIKVKVLSTGG